MGLSTAEAAEALSAPVNELGRQFMMSPTTRQRAKDEHGLRGRPMYHLGRGGALGDVPVEVVIAAEAFFPPDVVRAAWDEGRALMAPLDAAIVYAGYCADWGREHLAGLPDVDRAAELVERVVDAAEPAGLPLFAGWRRLPRPDDAPGRLALLVNVLREHRGAVHVAAVAAVGLDPLAAVCAGRYGPDNARFFEWPEPYPDPAPYRARWEAAEKLTATGAARPYDALSAAERNELVELVVSARAATLS